MEGVWLMSLVGGPPALRNAGDGERGKLALGARFLVLVLVQLPCFCL